MNHPTLRLGDKGKEVTFLQHLLTKNKTILVKPDGDFGRKTQRAVLFFQHKNNIAMDGVVGPKTWAKLDPEAKPEPEKQADPDHALIGLTAKNLGKAIIYQASRFVGLKEVRPNADWDNPKTPGPDTALVKELRDRMRKAPWQEGWAYCAAFVEAVVVAALEQLGASASQIREFSDVMQPGVMNSVRGFQFIGLLEKDPQLGSIWLAQHGATSQGHAGIVTSTDESHAQMYTIEANTSNDPNARGNQQREGDWITRRVRPRSGNPLKTRGFVSPQSILKLIKA